MHRDRHRRRRYHQQIPLSRRHQRSAPGRRGGLSDCGGADHERRRPEHRRRERACADRQGHRRPHRSIPASAPSSTKPSPIFCRICAGSICSDIILAICPRMRPAFHPVRVEMSRPDLRPSTRAGYYGVARRTEARSNLVAGKVSQAKAPEQTLEEVNFLKRLIENRVPRASAPERQPGSGRHRSSSTTPTSSG